MRREEIIQLEETCLAKVYHRRDLVIAKGKNAVVWDVNGKEYIDCMAGYGASFIGHSNPRLIEAIRKQAETLTACHSSTYSEARAQLAKRLANIIPKNLSRFFLSNSGSEAVEFALKASRKFTGKKEIIAMMRSFHGKTMGALSVTWNSKYRTPFEPLVPKIKFVPYGKPDKVQEAATADTAAIIVEPIQGESGVYPAPEGYLKELREISDDKNLTLIFDEIQTGFCRTGAMFAFQHWKVEPDILCLAKAAGSGVPIGITAAREDIMASFKIGEHSSTFGGNPLACVAASATVDVMVEGKLWEVAAERGQYFISKLLELMEKYRVAREVRGKGLMIGMELRFDVLETMRKMLERGVLILNAGMNTLRFLPPCVITEKQIDTVAEKLEECLAEKEREAFPCGADKL